MKYYLKEYQKDLAYNIDDFYLLLEEKKLNYSLKDVTEIFF